MCGIIGFVGNGSVNGFNYSIEGLKMLLNRGYDSCGCSGIINNKFITHKYANNETVNSFKILEEKKDEFQKCNVLCLHNRWKTTGPQTDDNAHPHLDMYNEFSLVHNGIIENYVQLKKKLIESGYKFSSQTDTEVIVNLISSYYKKINNVEIAIQTALEDLEGTYALCIMSIHTPNKLYCTRKGSPLLVSVTDNFGMVVSESSGFCGRVNNYICLENNDFCIMSMDNDQVTMKCQRSYIPRNLNKTFDAATSEPYPHWTIKEINEQIHSSNRTLGMGGRILNNYQVKLGGLETHVSELNKIDNIILLGCGTSYYAALEGAIFLKELCEFNTVQVFDGAEFTEKDIPKTGRTCVIFVSQSGETADLYPCVSICKKADCVTIGVINVVDSLIAREVDCGIYLNAGKEFGVASTKAFTSQTIALALIAIWFAQNKNINKTTRREFICGLRRLSLDISHTIELNIESAKKVAEYLKNRNSLFVLGKNFCEPIAKEGSLKIKEIGYIHAEAYSSSALKHGPYSLIENGTPVIILMPDDECFTKNNIVADEILSRYGYVIAVSDAKLDTAKFNCVLEIPKNKPFRGLLSAIPLQLIAYELAIVKGHNPDFPRNLAKCVTTH